MTPVHLIAVDTGDFKTLQGEDAVKTVQGMGTLMHTFCIHCGGGISQKPRDADFLAIFPSTFQIEEASASTDGSTTASCLLPTNLQADGHLNYENRLQNYYDDLPKYKAFPGGPQMTNEGQIIKES
jgi:hypothetical protein